MERETAASGDLETTHHWKKKKRSLVAHFPVVFLGWVPCKVPRKFKHGSSQLYKYMVVVCFSFFCVNADFRSNLQTSELEMDHSVFSGFQWFQGFRHNNRNFDFVREFWT